jgi:hypothetical protein
MKRLFKNRKAYVGASLLAIMMALGAAQLYLQEAIAQGKQAPRFEVDPYWPKPMPNNWVLGQAIGVSVDERDHVWMVHRGSDPGALDNTELAFPPAHPGLSVTCVPKVPIWKVLDFNGLRQACLCNPMIS